VLAALERKLFEFRREIDQFPNPSKIVSMHRTKKHYTKKEKFLASVDPNPSFKIVTVDKSETEGEPFMKIKDVCKLTNILIDQGSTYVEHAIKVAQRLHDHVGTNKKLVICALCAKKIGIKQCAQCPSTTTIRYCSRACQVADWPAHKACCGSRVKVN
jgi:hypothetical protein